MDSVTVFLSPYTRFSRWGDTPDRESHPAQHPTHASNTRPDTGHHQTHAAIFLCVSSTSGAPQGEDSHGPGHPGEGESEGRANTPSGQQEALPGGVQRFRCMDAKDQNLVGGKQI